MKPQRETLKELRNEFVCAAAIRAVPPRQREQFTAAVAKHLTAEPSDDALAAAVNVHCATTHSQTLELNRMRKPKHRHTPAKSNYSRRDNAFESGLPRDGRSFWTKPTSFGLQSVKDAGKHIRRTGFAGLIDDINR